MKFIIDAQLPRRIAYLLRNAGHDAVHTLDLPRQNATSDAEITTIAEQEQRIVVTKDADFVETFVLSHRPPKLVVIATGNIRNVELEAIIITALPALITALETNDYLEITRYALIIHG
jgi:predicted nuclease of predicted toxin-antitoxin system